VQNGNGVSGCGKTGNDLPVRIIIHEMDQRQGNVCLSPWSTAEGGMSNEPYIYVHCISFVFMKATTIAIVY
jgi:hypothetical protein